MENKTIWLLERQQTSKYFIAEIQTSCIPRIGETIELYDYDEDTAKAFTVVDIVHLVDTTSPAVCERIDVIIERKND